MCLRFGLCFWVQTILAQAISLLFASELCFIACFQQCPGKNGVPFVHGLKPKVNFDALNFTRPTPACACSACLRGQRMQRFRDGLQHVTCLGVQHAWLCKCNIMSFMQLCVCSLKCSTGSLHRAKICPTRPTLLLGVCTKNHVHRPFKNDP